MTETGSPSRGLSVAYLPLALVALVNSGCLLIAAGGAAAGGAAGYAYYKGKMCRPYHASFGDTWAAVHAALADLGMPIESEEPKAGRGFIQSRTGKGDRVRIYVDSVENPIPAEGPLTRVGVRVATFGDRPVSRRILYQVGAHLVPPGFAVPPPQSPILGPVQTSARTQPYLTPAEPPLAN